MIIYQKVIKKDDLRKNSKLLYLYPDNCKRTGNNGLSTECQGEANAVGIRVKRDGGRDASSYLHDKDLEANCRLFEQDLERVKSHLRRDGVVVMPADPIGGELQGKAPKTFYILQQMLTALEQIPVTIKS